jgi:hypothetical protein
MKSKSLKDDSGRTFVLILEPGEEAFLSLNLPAMKTSPARR